MAMKKLKDDLDDLFLHRQENEEVIENIMPASKEPLPKQFVAEAPPIPPKLLQPRNVGGKATRAQVKAASTMN